MATLCNCVGDFHIFIWYNAKMNIRTGTDQTLRLSLLSLCYLFRYAPSCDLVFYMSIGQNL